MCLANKTTPIFLVTTLMKIIQKIAVPNYPIDDFGAKLSVFTMLVPNCPFLLCWCQIVRFYYVGAKLSVCLLGAKFSRAKLSVF